MQKLIDGVHRFQSKAMGPYKELFHRLSREGQRPHSLFITCSDSRVLAELITQSRPGDLFVVKNVGNIVPPFSGGREVNSTAAAVEFAVAGLGVEDIVVCGHSQCGAMHALLEGLPDDHSMPHMVEWLKVAEPVRQLIGSSYVHLTDLAARATAAAEENVLFAIDNLMTYPLITRAVEAGALRLHAWFFKIATAELFAFDPQERQFLPLVDRE